jgi:hypothetical protein
MLFMTKIQSLSLLIVFLLISSVAYSQTEEDKKEIKSLITRLEKAETGKTEIESTQKKLVEAAEEVGEQIAVTEQKLIALEGRTPRWDSVKHITDENGNIVDKIFYQKPAHVTAWEQEVRSAIVQRYTLEAELIGIEEKKVKQQQQAEQAEKEITQVKRLIQLKQKQLELMKMFFPADCPAIDLQASEVSVMAIKSYWDCVFDGASGKASPLDENKIDRGTNFFSVVIPEYDKKRAAQKEKEINDLFINNPKPVKKPLVVPPPTKVDPTPPSASQSLLDALKMFIPKSANQ